LQKTLGFWQLLASGVGIIVGAGIYVLIGEAATEAGSMVWLSFIVAAGLSALTALSYCELASMFPRASAEYEYTSHAFPRWLAFLVGWVMTCGLVIAAAAVSLGFARYLSRFIAVDQTVLALALLAALCALGARGIKRSSRVTMALSAVQVIGLLLIIAVGIPSVGDVDLVARGDFAGVFPAAALVFFAFIGFDEVATLAEETRDASRVVPLALLSGLAISTVLYVAVAVAAVSVLGAGPLGSSERPLADVLDTATGSYGGRIVTVIAIVSTTNTTLLALTAGSRMVFGMSRAGALPGRLGGLGGDGAAPVAALIACGAAAACFVLASDLRAIAATTDAAIYLVFLATNTTVIILRFRQPDASRPFRVPLSIGKVPLVPVAALVATAGMMGMLDLQPLVVMLGMVALGGAVYAALH
jgi:APA family basic amino acid/polyamine antiporter